MKGVYLLHFEPRYRHAGHYLGYADDVIKRVHEHRTGSSGVKLTESAAALGVQMMLVRVWPRKGRKFERKLKGYRNTGRTGSLARICPACLEIKRVGLNKAHNRPPFAGVCSKERKVKTNLAVQERPRITVVPELTSNLYLDHTLNMKRGPDGVELEPRAGMGSGDGYLHFSIPTTVGEEAAWWAVGDDHCVPANIMVELLRPARVDGGTLTGRGHLIRAGRNIAVSEGTVCQGLLLIARVHVTFVLHFEKR